MIIISHKQDVLTSVTDFDTQTTIDVMSTSLSAVLFELAARFPDSLLIWCHDDLRSHLDMNGFKSVFHHHLIMASYEARSSYFISDEIGYVDSSPFVNIKRNVRYPTWLMSSSVGGVRSEVLLCYDGTIYHNKSLDYTLSSIAKQGMAEGLFCYSAPELLQSDLTVLESHKPSRFTLYKFVKEHYKPHWMFLVFFCNLIYEHRLDLLPLLSSLFISQLNIKPDLTSINLASSHLYNLDGVTVDVIIPTMGRKSFLYDVLIDLSKQTILPNRVIIVEQNPSTDSVSELDYITNKTTSWPFKIIHHFIHQVGACNARNLAISEIVSDYVFMADDDIRFMSNLLENTMTTMVNFELHVATLSCLQEGEIDSQNQIIQWHTFGTASSIVSRTFAQKVSFDMGFEYGYGEDSDYGMQLRNLGADIAYFPHCKLLHLKAPTGGFRTKVKQLWEEDIIEPKPSPTVMLFFLKYKTRYQLHSYRTLLFFNFFKLQPNKNIITYLLNMNKRWKQSLYWAKQLQSDNQLENR